MPRVKRGRPLSSEWKETAIAANDLGLTPDHLLSLRTAVFKPGKHYRVKNPNASLKGRRYLWHVKRCESLLMPLEEVGDRPAASKRRKPADECQL